MKHFINTAFAFFLSITGMLAACTSNQSEKPSAIHSDRLLEDPEKHIKDTPEIIKFDSTILYTGWYYIVETDNGYKRQLDQSTETYFIDPTPIVTAKNITSLEVYESHSGGQKYMGLGMQLDESGTQKWSTATEKSVGKKLAFILDNQLLMAPIVNSQITSGKTAINRGDYSKEQLENIKTIIESEK